MPCRQEIHRMVEDLPTIRELREQISGLRSLGVFFVNKEIETEIVRINKQLDDLTALVAKFYETLGSKNWVLSDYLSIQRLESILDTESPDVAEARLIEYFQEKETLPGIIMLLNRFLDMRPRIPLLEKAARDYLEGRFYSSVLVTISVMDGFKNDVHKDHRVGLHATSSEELQTNNGIATIHVGLPSAQAMFSKSVNGRIDEEIFDVLRNGIMHGMTTNYDNAIVATKAWCLLFAVCDWAKEIVNPKEPVQKPHNPQTIWRLLRGIIDKRKSLDEHKRVLDDWSPHEVDILSPSPNDIGLIGDCMNFFLTWKNQNYGELGTFFPNFTGDSYGKMAGSARSLYSDHPIDSFSIIKIDRPAASVAETIVRLHHDEWSWTTKIRLVKYNGTEIVADWEPGEWKVMRYGVDPFEDISEESS